jgi:hypothetical protein
MREYGVLRTPYKREAMCGPNVAVGSSTSFQAQAAHFRFSPTPTYRCVELRSATKSADARRGAADDGELRRAAGAAASVAADKRSVTGSQPHLSRFRRRGAACCGTGRFGQVASALLTTAASSRPYSSVLQKDGFISKISVQSPPSPPTGIGPSCGPRWRFA